MSDPMKQMEIEDVLSSIRRLVADEVAERAVPEALKEAVQPEQSQDISPEGNADPGTSDDPDPTEKLVLTAAQRVSESDQAPDPEDGNLETAEHPSDCAAEADEAPEASFEEIAEQAEEESLPSDAVADEWEEVSLEDRIAELEQAVAARDEDWEPDGSEVTAEEIQFTSLRATLQETDEAEERFVAPEGEPQAEATVVEEPPRTDEDADEAGSETSDEGPADDAASENMFSAEDPDVMDEEMLRQLVTDIVREELQGTLGERITRNVRKLVRREINTLLATRDFE